MLNSPLVKGTVSVYMSHIRTRNILLRMRTVRMCTKSSHLIKMQRNIDTVGLCILIQNRNYTCKVEGVLFFPNVCVDYFTLRPWENCLETDMKI